MNIGYNIRINRVLFVPLKLSKKAFICRDLNLFCYLCQGLNFGQYLLIYVHAEQIPSILLLSHKFPSKFGYWPPAESTRYIQLTSPKQNETYVLDSTVSRYSGSTNNSTNSMKKR